MVEKRLLSDQYQPGKECPSQCWKEIKKSKDRGSKRQASQLGSFRVNKGEFSVVGSWKAPDSSKLRLDPIILILRLLCSIAECGKPSRHEFIYNGLPSLNDETGTQNQYFGIHTESSETPENTSYRKKIMLVGYGTICI